MKKSFAILASVLMIMTRSYTQSCDFTDKLIISVGAIPTCGVITQLPTADQTLKARDKVTLNEGFNVSNPSSTNHTLTIKTESTIIRIIRTIR